MGWNGLLNGIRGITRVSRWLGSVKSRHKSFEVFLKWGVKLDKQEYDIKNQQMMDDEIDLVQLILILIKRKSLILCVVVLCLIVGGSFAFMRLPSYEYRTSVEIGSTIVNMESGDIKGIESPMAVLEKVKAAYIPMNSQIGSGKFLKISASSPKLSQLVILKNSGSQKFEEDIRNVHRKITGAILSDHELKLRSVQKQILSQVSRLKSDLEQLSSADLMKIRKSGLQEDIDQKKRNLLALNDEKQAYTIRSSYALAKLESELPEMVDRHEIEKIKQKNTASKERSHLDSLIDQKNNLSKNKKLLTQEEKLLTEQVAEISKSLVDIRGNRLSAPNEVTTPANALTLMMVENQLAQYQTRKENLDFKISVDLVRRENNLVMQLTDTQRQIIAQQDVLVALDVELEILEKDYLRNRTQLESQIQQFKADKNKTLADLERKYKLIKSVIANATNRLSEDLIKHKFSIIKQKQKIEELEAKLSILQPTKVLGVAVRSAQPVGPGKLLIFALSGILGLMGGVILAFIAEFALKVRQQQG